MIPTQEYAGVYRWDEAKERIPNDYDPVIPAPREGFLNKKDEEMYYDKLAEMDNDSINF